MVGNVALLTGVIADLGKEAVESQSLFRRNQRPAVPVAKSK